MKKPYHIVEKDDTRGLASFLPRNGQALLPMVELIEQSKAAVDELIDVLGRATIEAVLKLSAEGIAGPPHPGKKGGRGGLAWAGARDDFAARAEAARGAVAAEGASENQAVAKGLLEDAVRRGLATDRKYLFVMDGSKALRAAIDAVFGAENPVQRCRHHKIENVMGYLPDDLKGQVKAVMRSAFRLPAREGMARWEDGAALGRRSAADDRKEFSEDDGLPGSMDAGSGFGKKDGRDSGKGGVK